MDRDGVESITDDPGSVVEVVDLSERIVYAGKPGDLPSDVKGRFVARKRGSGIGPDTGYVKQIRIVDMYN